METQIRQNELTILESKIRRLPGHHRPGTYPLPEVPLRMAFEPPLRGIAAVMYKECRKHLCAAESSQKFGMVPKLHEVIRRRRGRAGEPVRRAVKSGNN